MIFLIKNDCCVRDHGFHSPLVTVCTVVQVIQKFVIIRAFVLVYFRIQDSTLPGAAERVASIILTYNSRTYHGLDNKIKEKKSEIS